jgi:glycogen synthase
VSYHPPVSVVINTDGRVHSLEMTLRSLRYLKYPNFEVCVVHGPTPDGTAEQLDRWRGQIKIEACLEKNLSKSRNIGIALAAGDIVAFIDDDAVPEPEWLNDIAIAYQDPKVGAAGGFVYNHTGTELQWRYGTMDRLARGDLSWTRPAPEFGFPFSYNVPHLLGTNSSLRREAAISIGGFDEEFDYFLDETDVLCRLNDAGWKIEQLSGAFVHHKYLASSIRNDRRVIKAFYSIFKNKIYFVIRNARGHHAFQQAIDEALGYINYHRKNLDLAIAGKLLAEHDRARFDDDVEQAWKEGLRRGLSTQRCLMSQETLSSYAKPFLKFNTLIPVQKRHTICLLTATYPAAPTGGIERYVHQLAKSVARLGHQVHVITSDSDHDTVNFEDGVWVHRIRATPHPQPPQHNGLSVPQLIWDHSATMLSEVKKVAETRAIDAVFAPIWNCQGIAFLLDGSFRLVTGLHTMFKHFLDRHERCKTDTAFMNDFIRPMLAFERLLLEQSDSILANSKAIVCEVERHYGITFDSARLGFVPYGLDDCAAQPFENPDPLPSGVVRVLFVGRLEERKGIEVFLEAAKAILRAHPQVHVDIVGNETRMGANSVVYQEAFNADRDAAAVRDRVSFHGDVSEAALRGYCRACDIFVAPSRFKSFGLILLAAMMFGKPAIGCKVGGMIEIVEDGVSGLLAEPGDVSSLTACLQQLVTDPQLRARLGAAARRRYESSFTVDVMARSTIEFVSHLPDKVRSPPAATVAPSISMPDSDVISPVPEEDAPRSERRIVVINSILARDDAVSASVRDTYHMLASDPTLRVSVFAHRNDFCDVPCHIVEDTAQLLLHPDYLGADLIIWHSGMYYELFNAALIGNGKARQVVIYHNTTPKQYLPESAWPVIERSLHQCYHLRYVDEVWNVSVVNAEVARAIGVAEDRIHVIPIPVDAPALSALVEKGSSFFDILFVGRFVAAKGVLDLIDAVARLPRQGLTPVRLTLAGNMEYSDPNYVDELRNKIVAVGLSQAVRWLAAVDDATREQLYRRAHILAIPSYHEGFCKPVIEGLRAGCIPIGYASYNLPEIANGLGRMVPTGNVQALTDALDEILKSLAAALAEPEEPWLPLDRGKLSVAEFDNSAHDYILRFARTQVGSEMLSRVYDMLDLRHGS